MKKILVIDDEEPLAEMLVKMLGGLGYDVIYQTSPVQALDLIKAEPCRFDLICSDPPPSGWA